MNDKQYDLADVIIANTSPHTGCVASHILGYVDPSISFKDLMECAGILEQRGLVKLEKLKKLNQPIIKLTSSGMYIKNNKMTVRQYEQRKTLASRYEKNIFIIVLVALVIIGGLVYLLMEKT